MMPTTPIGTRTRSIVMPFGRVQRSVTAPTGSARARTTSRPSAMAAMRRSSSARRSTKAAVAPAAFASATSLALAARMSARRARIAAAIAASALSFCAVGASASTRGAFRPRADLMHQGGDVGAFDGLERRGHGEIHVLSISPYHVRGAPARPRLLPRPLGKCNDGRSGTRRRQMKLKDQVAVVTGAGRNIGEEVAKLFAAEGAKVAIVDVDKPRGERVVGAIRGSGGEAELFTADVSKGSDVAALVRAVVERFGRIDILVNNVAISDNKHIFDITEEEWDRVLAVTLKSQFLMGKHVAQQMAAQGTGGRIVNIGSTSGFMGRSRAVAYSAAKGGVANLTRAMAAQLAPHKIRVNAIVPNKIGSPVGKDEFDPSRPVPNMAKRPGQPLEAAKAVLFLASEDSSFVYGANLFVDGGVSAMDLS